MTGDLLAEESIATEPTEIEIPDGEIYYYPSLFAPEDADSLFKELLTDIDWVQETITFFQEKHDLPRLTAWYGDSGKSYTYSGITVEPKPWTPPLRRIKDEIETVSDVKFNSVLLNLYRDGSDSVAWHSDDEQELGDDPVIGSVSFGEERLFRLKHKSKKEKRRIPLEHGSYLLMKGPTQHNWLHQIPKSKKSMAERINLTFRVIQ